MLIRYMRLSSCSGLGGNVTDSNQKLTENAAESNKITPDI